MKLKKPAAGLKNNRAEKKEGKVFVNRFAGDDWPVRCIMKKNKHVDYPAAAKEFQRYPVADESVVIYTGKKQTEVE